MKRRNFISGTIKIGITGLVSAIACSKYDVDVKLQRTIQKVKHTMLTMQRASWEQGVAVQALLEFGDKETVLLMAREAVVRQAEDGRLAVMYGMEGTTDPASNGEAVLKAAEWTDDPIFQDAADRMLSWLMEQAPRTENGVICHFKNSQQVWVDSMYMAPPFLAVAGEPDEAVRQIEGYRKLLWNPEKHLFSHQWDNAKKVFSREAFWGVGNGWAAAGMARVIHHLPNSHEKDKLRLAKYVHELLDGCLPHIRSDGFFHNVIDDPATFIETNLSQMLSYSIYRGIQAGWLPDTYFTDAEHMRMAAHSKIDNYGYVRDVCGSPFFNSPGTATEGQAFFILMEAARRNLLKSDKKGEVIA
ncbi:glycoside hydrolase family 88 protein [candidate division KSB1 bacterium]|nr:glycoside hydrolase family 88 protein [candidate division KSB1 bacterium]